MPTHPSQLRLRDTIVWDVDLNSGLFVHFVDIHPLLVRFQSCRSKSAYVHCWHEGSSPESALLASWVSKWISSAMAFMPSLTFRISDCDAWRTSTTLDCLSKATIDRGSVRPARQCSMERTVVWHSQDQLDSAFGLEDAELGSRDSYYRIGEFDLA